MSRQELENALIDIHILLAYEAQGEPFGEDKYQEWFENYRIVFELLGYKTVIPHPRLETDDGVQVPDFLVQGIDDIWSIFEIKRPDTEILKRQTKRQNFYSSFNNYIAQCHEYNEFFDDKANREAFNSKYSVDVHKSLKSTLVAGRDEGLDKGTIQKILVGQQGGRIDFKTYDAIIDTVEFHRKKRYGQFDDIQGFTAGGIFSVSKFEGKKNFIIDIGMDSGKNRISIYINENDELCLRVLDTNGQEYLTKIKVGSLGFCYDELFTMCFEVGIANNSTIIALEINCEYFKDIFIDNIEFNPRFIFNKTEDDRYLNILFGTDISFNAKSDFEFGEFFIYEKKLSFKLKNELRYHLFSRMREKIETTLYGVKSEQFASTNTNLISPRKQINPDKDFLVNLPYGIESLPKALFEFFPKTLRTGRRFKK